MDSEYVVNEEYRLPDSWEAEVFYYPEDKELEFSEPMTHNTWTNAPNNVGRIKSLYISDIEGFKQIDNNWVEADDGQHERPRKAKKAIVDYDFQYDNSSVITIDEALSRISDWAIEDNWYEDILEEIHKADNGEIENES